MSKVAKHRYRAKPLSTEDYHWFSLTWKDNCKDGFVYGDLIECHDRAFIVVTAMCSINSVVNNGMTSMIRVIPPTIDAFTGKLDKQGTPIYNNDIVVTKYGRECKVHWFSSPSYVGWDLEPLPTNENLEHQAPDRLDLFTPDNLLVRGTMYDDDVYSSIYKTSEVAKSDGQII